MKVGPDGDEFIGLWNVIDRGFVIMHYWSCQPKNKNNHEKFHNSWISSKI